MINGSCNWLTGPFCPQEIPSKSPECGTFGVVFHQWSDKGVQGLACDALNDLYNCMK